METNHKITNIEIRIEVASVERNIDEVLSTLLAEINQGNKTLPFTERVIKMLPELGESLDKDNTWSEINEHVINTLRKRFQNEKDDIQQMVNHKKSLVDEIIIPAVYEMLKEFDLSYNDQQQIRCYLGFFNPFPRQVLKKEYCIHYQVTDEVFIRASLHEINHMILFDKWESMGKEKIEIEPSFPDTLWYLEELTIEPFLNSLRMEEI